MNRFCAVLLLMAAALLNVLLLGGIEERARQINCFSYETAFARLRSHEVPEGLCAQFLEASGGDMVKYSELLAMYFATDNMVTDDAELLEDIDFAKKYRPKEFEEIRGFAYALWNDLECFPVGEIQGNPDATVSFENSWMQSRTFGGDRGHEGTDIMASVNERGIYPIYSMTDGVVENIGWLRLGGYRIGIRGDSGAYFYYAHMAEYAREFAIGERVRAGTFLGFMGDTGYSDIPGTTGNFDVHLHLGIYLNDADGAEFSVNSYPMLRYLWEGGAENNIISSKEDNQAENPAKQDLFCVIGNCSPMAQNKRSAWIAQRRRGMVSQKRPAAGGESCRAGFILCHRKLLSYGTK